MNKLSKEKRDQLILVCLGTLAAFAAVWFLLIGPEKHADERIKRDIDARKRQLQDMAEAITRAETASAELKEVSAALTKAEANMASGDPNAWAYEFVRHFKEHYRIDASVSGATIGEVDLIPGFPYKQLRATLVGSAFYHDLGTFVADFENTYPHMRIVNLALDPASNNGADGNEKLNFRMDLVALVKS